MSDYSVSTSEVINQIVTTDDGARVLSTEETTSIIQVSGSQGPVGATGPQGPQGVQGDTGPQGPAGAKGDKGDKGDTGDVGPQGQAGINGTNGQGVPIGGTANQVLAKIDGTDYNTQWINQSGGGGSVTDVTASSPLSSSGGATPNISIQTASTSQAGALSSTDWTTFNNKQAGPLTGDVTTSGAVATIGNAKVTNAMLAGSIDLTTKVTNALPFANGGLGFSMAETVLSAFGTYNNYAPSTSYVRSTTTNTTTISGIVKPSSGHQWLYWINTGTTVVNFLHNSSSSTSGNRFYTPSQSTWPLYPQSGMWLKYDTTNLRWVIDESSYRYIYSNTSGGTSQLYAAGTSALAVKGIKTTSPLNISSTTTDTTIGLSLASISINSIGGYPLSIANGGTGNTSSPTIGALVYALSGTQYSYLTSLKYLSSPDSYQLTRPLSYSTTPIGMNETQQVSQAPIAPSNLQSWAVINNATGAYSGGANHTYRVYTKKTGPVFSASYASTSLAGSGLNPNSYSNYYNSGSGNYYFDGSKNYNFYYQLTASDGSKSLAASGSFSDPFDYNYGTIEHSWSLPVTPLNNITDGKLYRYNVSSGWESVSIGFTSSFSDDNSSWSGDSPPIVGYTTWAITGAVPNTGGSGYSGSDSIDYRLYAQSSIDNLWSNYTDITGITDGSPFDVDLDLDQYSTLPAEIGNLRLFRSVNGGGFSEYVDLGTSLTYTDSNTGWASGSEPTPATFNGFVNFDIYVQWGPVTGNDGYRILVDDSTYTYDYYRDTTIGVHYFTDTGSGGWTAGNTVTPNTEFLPNYRAVAGSASTANFFESVDSDETTVKWKVNSNSKMIAVTPSTATASINLPAGTAPTSPVSGDLWQDSARNSIVKQIDGLTLLDASAIFSQTATQTIANTTTETTLFGTGLGTLTIPANYLKAGKDIRVRLRGFYSANSNPTLNIKFKLGGTTLCSSGATTMSNNTDKYFIVDVVLTCYTNGASGTVFPQGSFEKQGAAAEVIGMVATSAVTIDTTVTNTLDVTAEWSAASTSNTITSSNAIVEIKY